MLPAPTIGVSMPAERSVTDNHRDVGHVCRDEDDVVLAREFLQALRLRRKGHLALGVGERLDDRAAVVLVGVDPVLTEQLGEAREAVDDGDCRASIPW